jgi:hypothetical protein
MKGLSLPGAQEVPPWHGEAVLARLRQHRSKGSCRQHVGKAHHHTSTRQHQGEAGQLVEKLKIAMVETLGAGGDGAKDTGSNQRDLTDRQLRHREIYRMHPISMANSGGGGRNRGRDGSGDPVAGARARGGEGGASSGRVGERPSHLVGLDQVGQRPDRILNGF